MKIKGMKEDAKRIEKIIALLQKKIEKCVLPELEKAHINIPQFHILEILQEEGERTMGQLAKRLYITTSAVTNLVTKLLKHNLVNRRHSLDDRRLILIKISEKGREIVARVWEQVYEFFGSLLTNLNQEEKKLWRKLWKKVYSFLEKGRE